MGLFGKCASLVFFVILPLVVLMVAALVGYIYSTEYPAGTVFQFLGSTMPGSKNTPPVPSDFAILPRPANELFHDLPGGGKMPMIGLGLCCRPSAYIPESVKNSVLWYLLQGGRLLDGAQLYLNHASVGEGIREAIARGIPREEIFMTTKIGAGKDFGYKATTAWVNKMLGELGLDYVDLVLIHGPRSFGGVFGLYNESTEFKGTCEDCESARECRLGTWRALSEAREKGLIREVGVSNFRPIHMKPILELGLAPIAVHQLMYHPWVPEWHQENVDFSRAHNIKLTGYFSLGGSMNTASTLTQETLKRIAEKHKRTTSQVLLRWSIQKGVSVIPGSGNPKHMFENLETYSFELAAEDMADIDALHSEPVVDAMPEWMVPKE